MKRLKVMAFFVVVGLLAVAGPASAEIATSSILPIKDVGSGITILELVAPVSTVSLELVFFNASCTRAESVPKTLTPNDAEIVSVTTSASGVSGDGLVAIGAADGSNLKAAGSPYEARSHTVNFLTGVVRSFLHIRAVDPEDNRIAGATLAAFNAFPIAWPELRTGAFGVFPQVVTDVNVSVDFVCPTSNVYTTWTTGQVPTGPTAPAPISADVYNLAETKVRDLTITCKCFTQSALESLSATFQDGDRYVEFFGATDTGFKVYRGISVSRVGTVIQNQLNGVNRTTLGGILTTGVR